MRTHEKFMFMLKCCGLDYQPLFGKWAHAPQPRPQGAFPWPPHLQSQGKAPWGRGCTLLLLGEDRENSENRGKLTTHPSSPKSTLLHLGQTVGLGEG